MALQHHWASVGVALVAAVLGCRRSASEPSAGSGAGRSPGDAGAATVTVDEVQARAEPSKIEDLARTRLVDRALCRHAGCCVVSIEDAGIDRKGRTLVVAETSRDGADCLIPRPLVPQPFGSGKLDRAPSPLKKLPRPEPEAVGGDEPGEAAEATSAEGDATDESNLDCRIFDHHLVIIDKKKVRGRYTLSSECKDGGPVNYHMDHQMEVDPKAHTFTHVHNGQKGLSSWSEGVTVGLDPLRVIERFDERGTSIDWDRLLRRHTWTVPDEEALAQLKATPPPDAGEEGQAEEDGEGPTIELSAISVPKLALPASFTDAAWKSAGLGSCGVLIDGKDNGYTLHGEADAKDATLRVVASTDDVLFVEVTDDRWTGPSRSWVKDDHLELWLARQPSPSGAGNQQAADAGTAPATAVQWGIRIADGATFPAFGAPEPLKGVEVVRRGAVARVKIPFAFAGHDPQFAVVYSDGDDGKTQERLIATATLTRGDGSTLGGAWVVDPADATCAGTKGGALTLVRPSPSGGEPIGDPGKALE
jgi:hypothetical protein